MGTSRCKLKQTSLVPVGRKPSKMVKDIYIIYIYIYLLKKKRERI